LRIPELLNRQSHFFRATNELSTKSKPHRNLVMSGEADYGFHGAPRQKSNQKQENFHRARSQVSYSYRSNVFRSCAV
jgi:hypothetical protein